MTLWEPRLVTKPQPRPIFSRKDTRSSGRVSRRADGGRAVTDSCQRSSAPRRRKHAELGRGRLFRAGGPGGRDPGVKRVGGLDRLPLGRRKTLSSSRCRPAPRRPAMGAAFTRLRGVKFLDRDPVLPGPFADMDLGQGRDGGFRPMGEVQLALEPRGRPAGSESRADGCFFDRGEAEFKESLPGSAQPGRPVLQGGEEILLVRECRPPCRPGRSRRGVGPRAACRA